MARAEICGARESYVHDLSGGERFARCKEAPRPGLHLAIQVGSERPALRANLHGTRVALHRCAGLPRSRGGSMNELICLPSEGATCMSDLIFVLSTVMFFTVAGAYVHGALL